MADMMTFPNTVEEFMEKYKITDTEQIYTNGAELVPIFRMKQWFDHSSERKKGKWLLCGNHHLCSECDEWALTRWNEEDILTDFCPNCGAEMEVEVEE